MKITEKNKRIAVVDDEPDILELISFNLKKENYTVDTYADGQSFLSALEQQKKPDLLILDIMLPRMDGYEVCRQLKKNEKYTDLPIIMLSAKDEIIDKVLGLELGADDYLAKPFSPKELIARIKAVLRRNKEHTPERIIRVNDLITIDLDRYEVHVRGEKVELTTTEFKILSNPFAAGSEKGGGLLPGKTTG
jgi:DNA-binding response OmpR family regulator